jgi:hypothetical protein
MIYSNWRCPQAISTKAQPPRCGGRMVGHIQFMGLQLRSDPARPTLINTQYSPWNWGKSNPDTLYLSARIGDADEYRVYGRLGSVAQTTYGVYAGKDDQAQAVKALSEDLVVDDDGSFEIFFGREKMGTTNWFQLPPGADSFCAYQTYSDWGRPPRGAELCACAATPCPRRCRTSPACVASSGRIATRG